MKTAKKESSGFHYWLLSCCVSGHSFTSTTQKHRQTLCSSFSWLTCEVSFSRSSAHQSWWHSFSWCMLPSDWTVSRPSLVCCWTVRRSPPGSAEGESCWLDSRCGHRWTGRLVCAGLCRTAPAPGPSQNCQSPTCTAPVYEETTAFNVPSWDFLCTCCN